MDVKYRKCNLREFSANITPWQDVRVVGSDCGKDELLIRAGTVIGPAEVGMMAMAGHSDVHVYSRPLVGVISTGSELIDVVADGQNITKGNNGNEPQPIKLPYGKIFDANRPLLLALSSDPGVGNAEAIDFGIITDQEEENNTGKSKSHAKLGNIIQKALEMGVNVLITSGGVSVGDRDFVGPTLADFGKVHFSQIWLKPGKPLTFATIEKNKHKMLVFGVPGNPASAFVTFQTVVVPALRKMAGWGKYGLRKILCETADKPAIKLDSERPEFHRGVILPSNIPGNPPKVMSTGMQRSSKLSSLLNADCLMQLPSGESQKEFGNNGIIPPKSLVECVIVKDLRHSFGISVEEEEPNAKVIYPQSNLSLKQEILFSLAKKEEKDQEKSNMMIESFVFRELLKHLQERTNVQNIDMMNLTGFCRNCLSKWLLKGAKKYKVPMTYEEACTIVYSEPYADWKNKYQTPSTKEQMDLFEKSKENHAKHDSDATKLSVILASDVCCDIDKSPSIGDASTFQNSSCPIPSQISSPKINNNLLANLPPMRIGILTISDRAYKGIYKDESGPEIEKAIKDYFGDDKMKEYFISIVARTIIPDEEDNIEQILRDWSRNTQSQSSSNCNLILTTGGTGLTLRDVTPEATARVVVKQIPGIPEMIRRETNKIEPMAILSSGIAGITENNRSIIINLPGRPKAVRECMGFLLPLFPHCINELSR